MPPKSDLGTNSIERSGQLIWVEIPVILLVVQAHHLHEEGCIGDVLSRALNDYHFASTLQMDCDGWLSNEILCRQRTCAEIETCVEPDTPDRATVRLTS